MTRSKWGIVGLLVCAAGATTLWLTNIAQTGSALDKQSPTHPLLARGLMDAPAGTAVLGADPGGGAVLTELRVREGQEVKKGDIVAVLSNYANADVDILRNKLDLEKQQVLRAAMTDGFRATQIVMQEIVVQSARESFLLKELEMARSTFTPEMRKVQLSISRKVIDREELRLRVMKESLASESQQLELNTQISNELLASSRITRELALVRAPLDGTIVQVFTRPGERISPSGVAKIVDMSQMRIFADVDDSIIGRLSVGSKVTITIRGEPGIYFGKVARIAATVKRMQRVDPEGGISTDARVIQVEVELDDPARVSRALGREVKVSFL